MYATLFCTESFTKPIKTNRFASSFLLDLSKAFDSSHHKHLKQKLKLFFRTCYRLDEFFYKRPIGD